MANQGRETQRHLQRIHGRGMIDAKATMTGVEHAIAMSHKLALNKIHRNARCQYGLILEDDVTLQPDFAENLGRMLGAIRTIQKRVRTSASSISGIPTQRAHGPR